ncbi:MAG TPA: DNA polymerase III subunit gamma/tau [Anaerovoracaceae bacterium]|nr:DNA polymerase III subunit gamma/tau [Anaerovoracaceae bacterium]
MRQALYRKFRPETFEGVLGQEHIVKILQNQIYSNTVGHAYLFCGTRGTGKTTIARVLAKGVNCTAELRKRPCGQCDNCIAIRDGIFIDVLEIDAASNNGVENIRELRESVKYAPVVGKFKVYIIDEVHMLSSGAFNALLKTLEEPPEYVIFILATTEPQKLPATVLSRCMRLDFRRVSEHILVDSMSGICNSLNVKIYKNALGLIAANGDGSVRDSLSILDQCIAGGDDEVTREDVLRVLGTKGEEAFIKLTDMVNNGEVADALIFIDQMITEGIEVRQFIKDWISHYRNLMMIKFVNNPENILNVSEENVERMRGQSSRLDMQTINNSILQLSDTASEAKWSAQPRILLELCTVMLASGDGDIIAKSEKKDSHVPENIPEIEIKETEIKETEIQEKEIKGKENIEASESIKKYPDVRKLWNSIIDEAAAEKGSLRILGNACSPICIDDECLSLEVNNDIAGRCIEDNMVLLTDLMKKHTDKELRIDWKTGKQKQEAPQKKPAEQVAAVVSNRLNINVQVKKDS